GGTDTEEAWSIEQTLDGGYIVAADTRSSDGDVSGNHGYSDYWVVKLDAFGTIQWQRCLGGSASDHSSAIRQTSDGGYVVVGGSASTDGDVSCNQGGMDIWVVKLDAAGNM